MKKVLWVSDGVVPTGFSNVAHSIIDRIVDKYEVHHIALNYRTGDVSKYKHFIYPAIAGGDIYGVGYLKNLISLNDFDILFLFNDLPVIHAYLKEIRDIVNKDKTKIIVYFPVDSKFLRKEWFTHYDIVDEVVTYTEFGKREVLRVYKDRPVHVVYHGVDRDKFFRVDKLEALSHIFDKSFIEELHGAKIFLNANRNQPRKNIPALISGFSLFAKRERLSPKDVRLYLHMGVIDAGWDLLKLIDYYDISKYVLFTSVERFHPYVSIETLNYIYNASDFGINTSTGEGFGLVPVEHGFLGKQQIVPDNSVHREIFKDKAYYINCPLDDWSVIHTTLFKRPSSEDVYKSLVDAFYSSEMKDPSHLFNERKFDWNYITKQFVELFEK